MSHLLIESHLSTIIWHPPIDNRAFLGAVESSIIWQGVCASPCICNRCGDLGPSCGPGSDSNKLHPLQTEVWKALEMIVLDNHLQETEPLLSRVSSTEVTAQCWSKKEDMSLNAQKGWLVKTGGDDYDFKYKEATQNFKEHEKSSRHKTVRGSLRLPVTDPKDMETRDFLLENPKQLFYEYSENYRKIQKSHPSKALNT